MQESPNPPSGDPPDDTSAGIPTSRKVRTRRELLTIVSAGLGGIAATIVAIPVVGALVAPLVRPQPGEWRAVGAVDSFTIGETKDVSFLDSSPLAWAGPAANTAAWLRRVSDQKFQAFAINCTHLGCPVRWLQQADLFMCPCHGGVFYKDGSVAAGPPPKPLSVYPVRVRNGQVEIQTSAIPIG
jgi:menaquinol-cytochrome c reductase iron-sulfur subunit